MDVPGSSGNKSDEYKSIILIQKQKKKKQEKNPNQFQYANFYIAMMAVTLEKKEAACILKVASDLRPYLWLEILS